MALDFLRSHLLTAVPRKISACDSSRNLLIFSDGSFEKGRGDWGFVVYDASDGTTEVAGSSVPQNLINHWLKVVGDQVITQVELYAVLAARTFLGGRTSGRKVIYGSTTTPHETA